MSAPPSPSGEPAPLAALERRPALWLAALVLGLLAVRLALAGLLHLTEDEAYYRLWAQAPAAGYFDHPPMIAWWVEAGRWLAGDTALGVRLLPCLSCALTGFFVYDLARQLRAPPAAARRAVLWYNATLLIAAGGFLAVPDAPASLFWLVCLCALHRAASHRSLAWWLLAGAAAGLAALSKYSALFLGPGVLLWLLTSREGRAALRTPGPWLALVIAAGVFAPNVVWNAGHHWLTFTKQFGRITPRRFQPASLLELLVGQALLFNVCMVAFLLRPGALRRAWEGPGRLVLAATAPFFAYLLLHALHDRVQAHWPAPLYAGLALIAAVEAESAEGGRWRTVRRAAPWLGLGLAGVAAIIVAIPGLGERLLADPGRPLRGWRDFAGEVSARRATSGAQWVGTTSYGLAAQLLDEPGVGAPVVQIAERDRWITLKTVRPDMVSPGLIVDLPRRVSLSLLRQCFGEVQPAGKLVRGAGSGRTLYAAVRVAQPRRDVLRAGCWR